MNCGPQNPSLPHRELEEGGEREAALGIAELWPCVRLPQLGPSENTETNRGNVPCRELWVPRLLSGWAAKCWEGFYVNAGPSVHTVILCEHTCPGKSVKWCPEPITSRNPHILCSLSGSPHSWQMNRTAPNWFSFQWQWLTPWTAIQCQWTDILDSHLNATSKWLWRPYH